jgi:hypothetical protein
MSLLLAVVPEIGCELPVASDLLPHHETFASEFLRRRSPDLTCDLRFSALAHASCSRQPSDGRMTQNRTPLF